MNYKITFQLKTHISFIDKPVFDSIVAWCYLKDKYGFVDQTLSIATPENFDHLPLVKHEKGYFMASWMQYDAAQMIESTGSWKKRWANQHDHLVDFKGKTQKVLINAGQYKAYDMPLVLKDVKKVWFFFQSNDVSELERLISTHLWGIGKKTAQGYGEIAYYTIESLDYDPFAAIIRPIPAEQKDIASGKLSVKLTGWKPPYWLPENMAYCIVPQ